MAAETPLAERADAVETYPIRRDNVETEQKRAVMDRVSERVAAEFESVSTLDGVRVDLGDGWFLLRASGTQPLVRMTAEARTETRAGEIAEQAMALLSDASSE
jgi:phosphoglucosamine mutase